MVAWLLEKIGSSLFEPASKKPRKSIADELPPEEAEIIRYMERCKGRPLTQQEVNLTLEQARQIGDL